MRFLDAILTAIIYFCFRRYKLSFKYLETYTYIQGGFLKITFLHGWFTAICTFV